MNLFPLLALLAAPNPPVPINEAQMQDIHCVAIIGLAAYEQRGKRGGLSGFPELGEDGKRWAGIVGDRVMEATGQPREVVALAINESVKAEQEKAGKADDSGIGFRERLTACVGKMNANLGAIDAADGAAEAKSGE